jgi:hypothetical protein
MSRSFAFKGKRSIATLAFAAIVLCLAFVTADSGRAGLAPPPGKVLISGTAYAFFDIDDRVPGAVVRIEEYPELSAPVQADGSYFIEVPDDANVTPYIDTPAGYNDIYLQTFHTSGSNLEHVNFQVVPDLYYYGFAALLGVPLDENGRIEQCVIVSTFSIHEARDATTFDPGFKDVYPHGLPGSTATITPLQGDTRGPIYFTYPGILPDPAQTASSEDGGVLWVEVPPGYYWLEPEHPTERLAPFLAHCENGRLINANPPWGFYELKDGEEPDPAVMASEPDTKLDARVNRKARATGRGKKRKVKLGLNAGEPLNAKLIVTRGKRRLGPPKTRQLKPGKRSLAVRIRRKVGPGRASVKLKLADRAGNTKVATRKVRIRR